MSSRGFRDTLRRLRRDSSREVTADSIRSEEIASEEIASEGIASKGIAAQESAPTRSLPGGATTLGEPTRLTSEDGGRSWSRATDRELDSRHGQFTLDELRAVRGRDFALLTGDAALAEVDLERAVFLDTETSGLAGGAGTYVFMVGLGTFVRDSAGPRFEVWQGFLRDPGGEAALLEECAARIAEREAVVSFFGKSFDRHRLEDKMRLHGVAAPFEGRPHLDLYHPCRRLYRGAYGDGRLKTLERELCGLQREDDLPGAFAPEAWFDYLAGRPHRLEGVFRHNLDDVLSLVTLAAHLGRSTLETRLDGRPLGGDGATRAAGLARSLLATGEAEEALRWLRLALERGHREQRELALLRAVTLRKRGEHAAAGEALRTLVAAGEDRFTAHALQELAKLLEHGIKQPAAALEAARVARHVAPRTLVGREYALLAADLERRVARLESRLARG